MGRAAAGAPVRAACWRPLEAALPDDAVVVADMCVAGYWYGGYGRVAQPRGLAYPVGWGTLGFGFPAALGAALSGRPTVAVVGDGGFLFGCGDLATAAQERLPVTVVLVDDGGYGMLRYDFVKDGEVPVGTELEPPDFVALAAGVPRARAGGRGRGARRCCARGPAPRRAEPRRAARDARPPAEHLAELVPGARLSRLARPDGALRDVAP